jgi:hypothetical protein
MGLVRKILLVRISGGLAMKNIISGSVVGGLFISIFLLACLAAYAAESPYELAWVRQLGTSDYDHSNSVAVDTYGNAFISGWTTGGLEGQNAGSGDAFLAKYDSSGSLLWTRQLGTSSNDHSQSVAVDAYGNAFISGYTEGSLGGPNAGDRDAFLSKYDSSGSLLWTRQLGTAVYEESAEVAVDASGNAYICGPTFGILGDSSAGSRDAFLVKYDPSGSILWTRQFGTSSEDGGQSVVVDAYGNIYVSGWTEGNLDGSNAGAWDAFLAKFDSSGSLLWKRQIGTSSVDYSESVAVDASGNAYISGYTEGSLGGPNAGGPDAFLAKYDSSGSLLWTRQIGTSDYDHSLSVAVDASGSAYIFGGTDGSIGGPNAGYRDSFLAKYNSSGSLLWTSQIGTSNEDYSTSVAVEASGSVYASGYTEGSLGGPNAGGYDAFLVKYSPVPEPAVLALIAPAILGLAGVAFRKMRRD